MLIYNLVKEDRITFSTIGNTSDKEHECVFNIMILKYIQQWRKKELNRIIICQRLGNTYCIYLEILSEMQYDN